MDTLIFLCVLYKNYEVEKIVIAKGSTEKEVRNQILDDLELKRKDFNNGETTRTLDIIELDEDDLEDGFYYYEA